MNSNKSIDLYTNFLEIEFIFRYHTNINFIYFYQEVYKQITNLKNTNANLKILFAIGGKQIET